MTALLIASSLIVAASVTRPRQVVYSVSISVRYLVKLDVLDTSQDQAPFFSRLIGSGP